MGSSICSCIQYWLRIQSPSSGGNLCSQPTASSTSPSPTGRRLGCVASGLGSDCHQQLFAVDLARRLGLRTEHASERTSTPRSPLEARPEPPSRTSAGHRRRAEVRLGGPLWLDAPRSQGRAGLCERGRCGAGRARPAVTVDPNVIPSDEPLIHRDPDVLGGAAVFAGSRLPVTTLLACLDAGDSWERVIASWPWLTVGHVEAARRWAAAQRRGSSAAG